MSHLSFQTPSRREFLRCGGIGALGLLGAADLRRSRAATTDATARTPGFGRAKSVLDASLSFDSWEQAFEVEYTHQDWSMDQPAFQEKLAELRAKLQKD